VAIEPEDVESIARVRFDLVTAKALVWVASRGHADADLTPEAHVYLFERYQRLANHHRRHGHDARAKRLQEKADAHRRFVGDDGPPFAAAMGMPRPRYWVVTDAVSNIRINPPNDAA
jgi:ribosomal protein S15P/S13E